MAWDIIKLNTLKIWRVNSIHSQFCTACTGFHFFMWQKSVSTNPHTFLLPEFYSPLLFCHSLFIILWNFCTFILVRVLGGMDVFALQSLTRPQNCFQVFTKHWIYYCNHCLAAIVMCHFLQTSLFNDPVQFLIFFFSPSLLRYSG
jgi:hypothetical protein